MKQVNGIWLPSTDNHLPTHFNLMINPLIDGKATYQWRKYVRAMTHVKHRGHAVDIGAQIGLWTRVMALDFERVTSFEPLPEHHECFELNVTVPNVILHKVALSDGSGEFDLVSPAETTGNTHVMAVGEIADKSRVVTVSAHPMDSFGLTDINFLKIDVEGYELPVVLGAERTIRKYKPVIIIEQKPNGNAERYGRKRLEALDTLKSWGGKVAWEISGDFLVEWK